MKEENKIIDLLLFLFLLAHQYQCYIENGTFRAAQTTLRANTSNESIRLGSIPSLFTCHKNNNTKPTMIADFVSFVPTIRVMNVPLKAVLCATKKSSNSAQWRQHVTTRLLDPKDLHCLNFHFSLRSTRH